MNDNDDILQETISKLSKLCSTGNDSLDSNLGGGIPWGSFVIVNGENSSGKSSLMQQFTMGALMNNHKVTYISTEQTLSGLLKNMDALSWKPNEFFLQNKFQIIPTISEKRKSVTDTQRNITILNQLLPKISSNLIIIDTLDYFTQGFKLDQFHEFFTKTRQIITEEKIIIFVFPTFFFKERKIDRLAKLFDIFLEMVLENDEGSGSITRMIYVRKFRSLGELTSEKIPIEVDPAFGIRVSAISSA